MNEGNSQRKAIRKSRRKASINNAYRHLPSFSFVTCCFCILSLVQSVYAESEPGRTAQYNLTRLLLSNTSDTLNADPNLNFANNSQSVETEEYHGVIKKNAMTKVPERLSEFSLEPIFKETNSETQSPTDTPTFTPTSGLTLVPTLTPSSSPTSILSVIPSTAPTYVPSSMPSTIPSVIPSAVPSILPTEIPSSIPSITPSVVPSVVPSVAPSNTPSALPSSTPSVVPTVFHSVVPSDTPSAFPSITPSVIPSTVPSLIPSTLPSVIPTSAPSSLPSVAATFSPSINPTASSSIELEAFSAHYNQTNETVSVLNTTVPSPSVVASMSPTSVPTTVSTITEQDEATPSPTKDIDTTDMVTLQPTYLSSETLETVSDTVEIANDTIVPTLNATLPPTETETSLVDETTQMPTLLQSVPFTDVLNATAPPSLDETMQMPALLQSVSFTDVLNATAPPSLELEREDGDERTEIANVSLTFQPMQPLNPEQITIWEQQTSAFYQNYYNSDEGFNRSVYIVAIETTFRSQDPPFKSRLLRLSSHKRRVASESLVIYYTQTIKYRTTNSTLSVNDIVKQPLTTEEGRESYINTLQSGNSSAFSDVAITEMKTYKDATFEDNAGGSQPTEIVEGQPPEEGFIVSKFVAIISAVGGFVAVLILFSIYILYEKKKSPNQLARERLENIIDNVLASGEKSYSFSNRGSRDLDSQIASSMEESEGYIKENKTPGDYLANMDEDYSASSSFFTMKPYPNDSQSDNISTMEIIDIFAPPGKLGVLISTADAIPLVHSVKSDSTLTGKLIPGDTLVAVDDVDVRHLSASKISKLISRKRTNPTRKFTVLRNC